MIDHLFGRPNPSWKRAQVFLVIIFWVWRIAAGNSGPPKILWLTKINRALRRFTPWQIVLSTLTGVYAIRNLDKVLGLDAPEPLARLYSPSYYRATWIATGLDAGFATAMSIRRKWLRDLASIIFSVYYIVYANEADEKLRRFRAKPTVEMLRTTWEKTTNPYIRLLTYLPRIGLRRKILLPRPTSSSYDRPITAYLFFAGTNEDLCKTTELIFDLPGGGFVAMTPEHHEERLGVWAASTKRPVLSLDYGKSPEYPYPFAVDEAFDAYRLIVESHGQLIGMSGKRLSVIVSGDSAGGTLAVSLVLKILELREIAPTSHHPIIIPLPTAMVLSYAALDFNFTSWMTVDNLRVLRSEQSSGNLKELAEQKDHLKHISPLSMVRDRKSGSKRIRRGLSWRETFRGLANGGDTDVESGSRQHKGSTKASKNPPTIGDEGVLADAESDEDDDYHQQKLEDRPIEARIIYNYPTASDGLPRSHSALERQQPELSIAVEEANTKATKAVSRRKSPTLGTRLTMTSRTGHFQDRIISPSMMRAMAIFYIGPHLNPDFTTDYRISPILAPSHLLAQFPPLCMHCGEKDPFVDDTVVFAGRVREAKRARKTELDLAFSGKSARFGESLRMSSVDNGKMSAEMKRERDKLAKQAESDWVEVVLFSEWSHGYLQMPTLMPEVRVVIEKLAGWIDAAFEKYHPKVEHTRNGSGSKRPATQTLIPPKLEQQVSSPLTSEAETDDTGITFIPRRQAPSCDSDATLVNATYIKGTVVTQTGVVQRTQTPEKGSTATISESELMRRRRLISL